MMKKKREMMMVMKEKRKGKRGRGRKKEEGERMCRMCVKKRMNEFVMIGKNPIFFFVI